MKIAVLSGKGGAGKTLVSVNLASVLENSTYIDCDVEEPNGRLFFKPQELKSREVHVFLPQQIESKCTGCRKCVDVCRFNALAFVNDKLMVFDEVCHACYACFVACKNKAMTLRSRQIGVIEEGIHNNIKILSGILNIGEASGIPIIKDLITNCEDKNVIIDCPPGSACSVMESIKNADYCVLVAEPTAFGMYNLNMINQLVTLFNKKFGVIINKNIPGENLATEYCYKNNIKIIGKIDWDLELAQLSTNAKIAVEESEKYNQIFKDILANITNEVKQ